GVKVASALFLFLLPWGRPRRRLSVAGFCCLGAPFARLAAFPASLRTTCSTYRGNERRSWVLTNDSVKNASPGTGLLYRLAKNRSRPWVCLPALVTTTSSPASR